VYLRDMFRRLSDVEAIVLRSAGPFGHHVERVRIVTLWKALA
jgi:hypothetical protein